MSPAWIPIVIPVVALAILGALVRRGAREQRVTELELATIRALSEPDAERFAQELLARPGLFQTRPASKPFTDPDVPPHVRALLDQFEEVVCGELWVGVAALNQPARLPGYPKIGEDSEFTEILVRPGDSKIHVSYGDGPQSLSTLETETSIWHEIIVASGLPHLAPNNRLQWDVLAFGEAAPEPRRWASQEEWGSSARALLH